MKFAVFMVLLLGLLALAQTGFIVLEYLWPTPPEQLRQENEGL